MPGYYIADYQEAAFDSYSFNVTEAGNEKKQAVEGHRYDFRYNLREKATEPSQLQVVRNYQNAARSAGGQVLYGTGRTPRFVSSRAARRFGLLLA